MKYPCQAPGCNSDATIYSRDQLTDSTIKLYYKCKNPECGCRFTALLEFCEIVKKPKVTKDIEVVNYLKSLNKSQVNELFNRVTCHGQHV